jgi:5-methyltetrahydropteroyltriglutamate--homocysteine methyltransferase
MTLRRNPPFRAEHVGSLLRPRALKDAFRAIAQNQISQAQFQDTLNICIRDAVKLQESLGLRVVTDGEFRRGSWFNAFLQAVDGLEERPSLFDFHDDSGGTAAFATAYCSAPLERTHGITTDEFAFVKSAAKTGTPKVTMPAPSVMHFFRPGEAMDRAAYPDEEVYWRDLTRVYREEMTALGELGCTYVQLDEVPCAMLGSEMVRGKTKAAKWDPDALVTRYIAAINAAVADRPAGMTVGLHMCQGNYKGRWMSEGGYGWIAERLFNGAEVDAFFLEYDSARAGGFEPLRHMPAGKTAVLGLVSTKTPQMESKDTLKRRIDEAARFCALDRLAISPQCGFASSVAGNPISEDDQKRKLALVVETAVEIWGSA